MNLFKPPKPVDHVNEQDLKRQLEKKKEEENLKTLNMIKKSMKAKVDQ